VNDHSVLGLSKRIATITGSIAKSGYATAAQQLFGIFNALKF